MSVLGSNLAASISTTMVQAPQAARSKQQQDGRPENEIRRVREAFETHLQALGEGDNAESSTHLHVDGRLPDQSGSDGQREEHHRKPKRRPDESVTDEAATPPVTPAAPTGASSAPDDGQLYRHVDVQA